MRKSFLMLVLAALLGLGLTSSVAWARPSDIFKILLLINGEPAAVGVLTSAGGGSVTNASTAVPFSLPAAGITSQVLLVSCDALAYVGFSTTCGTTLATSNGCVVIRPTDPPKVIIVRDTQTTMNAAGPAAFNCLTDKLQ